MHRGDFLGVPFFYLSSDDEFDQAQEALDQEADALRSSLDKVLLNYPMSSVKARVLLDEIDDFVQDPSWIFQHNDSFQPYVHLYAGGTAFVMGLHTMLGFLKSNHHELLMKLGQVKQVVADHLSYALETFSPSTPLLGEPLDMVCASLYRDAAQHYFEASSAFEEFSDKKDPSIGIYQQDILENLARTHLGHGFLLFDRSQRECSNPSFLYKASQQQFHQACSVYAFMFDQAVFPDTNVASEAFRKWGYAMTLLDDEDLSSQGEIRSSFYP